MKTIYLLLITSFTYGQSFPVIFRSANNKKVDKKSFKTTRNFYSNNFKIFFYDTETAATGDLRNILDSYTFNTKNITIQKVPLGIKTGQGFFISANQTDVLLQYTTRQSLDNAIYSYMNLLGIQWYAAGDRWQVKPALLNDVNISGEWREPTFRNRTFDGTGGLDYALSTDPTNQYKKTWYEFKRRNRFNADFIPPSHAGQAFYIANQALCNANPSWFNGTTGMQSGRIRIEIPAAVDAYYSWLKTFPKSLTDSFLTVNVDPEDGRGGIDDPLPPDGFRGLNNWNASEKEWSFANDIASRYDSNDNHIKIGALSYGDGATITLVPRFPLKKNVLPMLTPYAFQTAYLPKQMVRTWHRNTAGFMNMYDYWNITQYSLGLPQFNVYSIPSTLQFWKDNNIQGIQQETTDANGPTAHMFWLTGQLEFDNTKSIDTIFKKYLVDCYAGAWQEMKKMYDRWSLNYQNNYDVNYSLRNLFNASQLVTQYSPEWNRINDMKAYVHFMKMMAQRNIYVQSSNDSVYQYLYSIHNRTLVQTVAFTGQRYLGTAPTPTSAHQLTDLEVENNFNTDLINLPVQFELSNFKFDYAKVGFVDSIPLTAWRFGLFAGARFKAKTNGFLSVDIGTRATSQAKIYTEDSSIVNESLDYNNNFAFAEIIGTDTWHMKNYNISVDSGKIYNLGTSPGGFGRVRIRTANINLFLTNGANDFDNAQYPIKYFYVPIGTTQIAYFDSEIQGLNSAGYLVTPTGAELIRQATNAAGVYTVNVPAGTDGKVWKARFGHSNWSFANIPNISSLQNFSYTE